MEFETRASQFERYNTIEWKRNRAKSRSRERERFRATKWVAFGLGYVTSIRPTAIMVRLEECGHGSCHGLTFVRKQNVQICYFWTKHFRILGDSFISTQRMLTYETAWVVSGTIRKVLWMLQMTTETCSQPIRIKKTLNKIRRKALIKASKKKKSVWTPSDITRTLSL